MATPSFQLSQIPTENQIARHLKSIVFGQHICCPKCKRHLCVIKDKKRRYGYICNRCKTRFSLISKTWMRNMKISLKQLWILIWLWEAKLNIEQAVDLTGLTIPTIRRYYQLFRENIKTNNDDIILKEIIQIDEMFVKKAFIIGAKDIKNKKIRLIVNKHRTHPIKLDAMNLIQNHVKSNSIVCTDGSGIYFGIDNFWPVIHKRDIHKKFQFEITSEIEGIWANFRTFIRRMYHHVTNDKLEYLVEEFVNRFNNKEIFENPLTFLKNSLTPVTLAL